jgi:hypothetical protein
MLVGFIGQFDHRFECPSGSFYLSSSVTRPVFNSPVDCTAIR